ncbi:expressed protein [Phakopsora pachyrhizi]|uniref:Expressed protein n=1 Tax=Phakopsora pachyrhizi TaxID=170000 RepID=A0AAV0AJ60_PHAPC|nr:expressed protein [Phakopsora pachyrhizi]
MFHKINTSKIMFGAPSAVKRTLQEGDYNILGSLESTIAPFIKSADSDDNSPHRKKNLSSSDGVDLPQIADRNKVSSNFSTLTEPHPSWNSKNQSYQGNQSEGVEIPQLAPIPVSNSELNPQRSTEAFPEVREKPIIKQQRAANMSTLYGSFPVANPNEQQKTVGESVMSGNFSTAVPATPIAQTSANESLHLVPALSTTPLISGRTSVPAPASFPVGSYMNLNRTNAKSSLENSHSTNVTKSLAQSSETTEKLAQLNQENHKLSAGQIAGISISASIVLILGLSFLFLRFYLRRTSSRANDIEWEQIVAFPTKKSHDSSNASITLDSVSSKDNIGDEKENMKNSRPVSKLEQSKSSQSSTEIESDNYSDKCSLDYPQNPAPTFQGQILRSKHLNENFKRFLRDSEVFTSHELDRNGVSEYERSSQGTSFYSSNSVTYSAFDPARQVNEHQPPPILPLNPPPRIDGKSLNVGPISKIHLPTRLSICFEAPKLSTPGPKAIETPALNQVDTAGLVEEVEEIEEAEILERQAVSFGYLAKKD